MYENGMGVKKDYKKAIYWYEKSADQGNSNAQYHLGLMIYIGQGLQLFDSVFDDGKALVKLLKKSADQDNIRAQNLLGTIYLLGKGEHPNNIEKDSKKAIYWLEKVVKQDDSDDNFSSQAHALITLSRIYSGGIGVKKDYKKAFYWTLLSAQRVLCIFSIQIISHVCKWPRYV